MSAKIIPNPDFEERVRASFSRQQVMTTLQAELTSVTPGIVEIEMPYSEALTQQHGFLHAGIISAALDSACGYAAFSLLPENASGPYHRVQGQSAGARKGRAVSVSRLCDQAWPHHRRRGWTSLCLCRRWRSEADRHDDRHDDDSNRAGRRRRIAAHALTLG